MARAADSAAIHYRMLNASKGAAVQGPRIQADRKLYREAIQNLLAAEGGITLVAGEAAALRLSDKGYVEGLDLADGSALTAGAVVLATGTFLGGRSEEHTSELQLLMRLSYAVFCLKNKNTNQRHHYDW